MLTIKKTKAFIPVWLFVALLLFLSSSLSIAADKPLEVETIIKNFLGSELEGYVLDADHIKQGDLDGDGNSDVVAIPWKGLVQYYVVVIHRETDGNFRMWFRSPVVDANWGKGGTSVKLNIKKQSIFIEQHTGDGWFGDYNTTLQFKFRDRRFLLIGKEFWGKHDQYNGKKSTNFLTNTLIDSESGMTKLAPMPLVDLINLSEEMLDPDQ